MKPLVQTISAVVISLVLCSSSSLSQDSCAIAWNGVTRVSFDLTNSINPCVVTNGDTIHILWFGQTSSGLDTNAEGIQYCQSYNGGLEFYPQVQLVPWLRAGGLSGQLATSGNFLYMMYVDRQGSPVVYSLAVRRSPYAGDSWDTTALLGDYSPGVIVARDSNVYIYCSYQSGNVVRGALMASHDYGSHWAILNDSIPNLGAYPAMTLTSGGLHIARSVGTGLSFEVFYLRSTDFGYTWTQQETLSTNDGYTSDEPKIRGDDNGNLYVVWRDGKYGSPDGYHGSLIVRKSSDNGATWGPEMLATQTPSALFPRIAVNQRRVIVAWDHFDGVNYGAKVRLFLTGPGQWCDPVTVDSIGDYIDITTTETEIRAVWSQGGEIYYQSGTYGGPLVVKDNTNLKTSQFSLQQNYPNPFNPQTTITFSVPSKSPVSIEVFNLLGQKVKTLLEATVEAGPHNIVFNGSTLPSALYFYRLTTAAGFITKKMILLR